MHEVTSIISQYFTLLINIFDMKSIHDNMQNIGHTVKN